MQAMTRWRAFGLHLLLSAALVGSYLLVVYLFWYTGPFFALQEAWLINRVAILVDVMVGPLLTLILFRPGKRGLRFDMAMVIGLQVCALLVGIWYTFLGHPQFVAFNTGRLMVVNYADIDQSRIPDWVESPLRGPLLVYAEPPRNAAERNELVGIFMQTGLDIERLPQRYRPVAEHWQTLLSHDLQRREETRENPQFLALADAFAAEHGRRREELVYLPVVGRSKMATLVLDRQTREVLGSIDADFY